MKHKVMPGIVLCGLLAATIGIASPPRPNFGGTWKMDRARSFGLPPDVQQTMIVTQTEDKIELETKITNSQGENSIKDSYVVDGVEREFTPQTATGPQAGAKGKRKATWLPNGRGIVVEEETTSGHLASVVDEPRGPGDEVFAHRVAHHPVMPLEHSNLALRGAAETGDEAVIVERLEAELERFRSGAFLIPPAAAMAKRR